MRERTFYRFLYSMIIVLSVLTGCGEKQLQTKNTIKINKLIVNNIPPARKIEIVPPVTEYINDILHVTLNIVNKSDQKYNDLIYRFKWYDQDGYEVGQTMSIWKPVFLESKDSQVVTETAPSPKAEKFKFYISVSYDHSDIQRIDPHTLTNESLCYGADELHLFAEQMVSSMLRDKLFDGKPIIAIYGIDNHTNEKIDTDALISTIQTQIIKSKRARFVDPSLRNLIKREITYQQNNKYIDQNSSVKTGKQIAPKYFLTGAISTIKNNNDFFYKIILKLNNLETGIVEWAEEKEIRKVGKDAK